MLHEITSLVLFLVSNHLISKSKFAYNCKMVATPFLQDKPKVTIWKGNQIFSSWYIGSYKVLHKEKEEVQQEIKISLEIKDHNQETKRIAKDDPAWRPWIAGEFFSNVH